MDKLIGLIVDIIRKLFGQHLESEPEVSSEDTTELRLLRERKELSPTRIWLLDIFEKNPDEEYTTSELFEVWSPLVLNRTEATESDITTDSCFVRLQDLQDKGFLIMEKTRRGKMWAMSSVYREHLIVRDEDVTTFQIPDEKDL